MCNSVDKRRVIKKYVSKVDKEKTYDISEWIRWSTTPHTEEEIRDKALSDYDNICFSYVCKYSDMSADFLEEFMALSTGLLNYINYEECLQDVMTAVQSNMGVIPAVDITKLNIPTITVVRDTTGEHVEPGYNNLKDKIDWVYISQKTNLPQWFRLKYVNQLKDAELMAEKSKKQTSDDLDGLGVDIEIVDSIE
ncbi:MAG: hypothetical protein J6A59_02175 [Lachnospiraceae bacterium]|nr:hypothetical protein [Lachnospiraceae bacterium]